VDDNEDGRNGRVSQFDVRRDSGSRDRQCQQVLAAFDPADPAELVWTVDADSYVEAMTLYHEHMGWGPYRPMD
jgi:hypothetical protein